MDSFRLEEDGSVSVSPEVGYGVSAMSSAWKKFQATVTTRARTRFACKGKEIYYRIFTNNDLCLCDNWDHHSPKQN